MPRLVQIETWFFWDNSLYLSMKCRRDFSAYARKKMVSVEKHFTISKADEKGISLILFFDRVRLFLEM